MEPSKQEKKFLQGQKKAIAEQLKQERIDSHLKSKEAYKDLYCMGISQKVAKGPNPLSMLKKRKKVISKEPKIKKRRIRKGKRSKVLSAQKKLNGGERKAEMF